MQGYLKPTGKLVFQGIRAGMLQTIHSPDECSPSSETSRQIIHMLVGVFALLLRWLSYSQALACALAAIVFNSFILPRLPGSRRYLYRSGEQDHGVSAGIFMYPISVFLLILLFPMPVAASMWGVLAFGDALATLVGTRRGKIRLPWNRRKSLEGMLAFVSAAAIAATFLYLWTLPNIASSPPWWRGVGTREMFSAPGSSAIVILSLTTVAASAFLETLETRLDDNIVAPLGGACLMVGLIYVFFG